jgi:ABC-type transport system involved in multi-copper enzyme maturation permease subunit
LNLVVHHLKKDIRHLRSLLVLWFLLLLVNSLLMRSGLDRFVASDEGIEVLATAYVLLYVLQQILQIVIVCQLVQADALAGTTAFWLTRPIARKELLLSKSLFVLLILVLPSLLAEVVVLRVNGISVSFILSALAEEIILQSALFLVPAMLVAALTPNLVRLVVAGLTSATAFFLIHYAVLATVMAFGAGSRRQSFGVFPGQWPRIFPTTPSGMLVSAILMIGLGVAVICYQYLKRRTVNSAASAALGLCLVVTTLNFWPWGFRTFGEGLPPRSGLNPEGVKLVVHREAEAGSVIGDHGRLTIFGKIEFQGIPPSFFLELTGLQGTLRLPDGKLLPSSSDYPLFFGEGFQFDKKVKVLNESSPYEPSPWPTVFPLLSVDAQHSRRTIVHAEPTWQTLHWVSIGD